MKNRLQIKYYMPSKFPYSREKALEFIKNSYHPKNNEGRLSLVAEPIAVFYNDNDEQIANANVILAFGRGGDEENPLYNEPYFIIDSARMEKDITDLQILTEEHTNIINRFKNDIDKLYQEVASNKNEINNIWKKIGDKSDGITLDTVYGYVNNRFETIVGGKEPNSKYPTMIALAEGINSLTVRLNEVYNDINKLVNDLNTERSDRQSADIELDKKIVAKTLDINNRITELAVDLNNEIDTLTINLNTEVSERKQADSTIESNLNKEIENRTNGDITLDGKIESEANERAKQDAILLGEITEEKTRAENAESGLAAQVLTEKNRAEEAENNIRENIVSLEERMNVKLDTQVNALKTKDSELSAEIKALQTVDSEFAVSLTNVNASIATEAMVRENKDNELNALITSNAEDIKKNKVVSKKETILVTQPDNTTNIEVNVDGKTIKVDESTGSLFVVPEALTQYKGVNAIVVSDDSGLTKTVSLKLNENEKVLSNEENGLLTNITLKWDNQGLLQLLGKNSNVISEVNMKSFVKDGLLSNVYLDQENPDYPELVFTFIVGDDTKEVRVPVKDLLYVYKAGNGLQLNGDVFDIKLSDNNDGKYLTVNSDGLKLSGIDTFVNEVKNNIEAAYKKDDELIKTDYTSKISEIYSLYTPQIDALTVAYKDSDNLIRAEFAAADANVTSALTEMFSSTNSLLAGEIKAREEQVNSLQIQLNSSDEKINEEVSNRLKADEQNLISAKDYTDVAKNAVEVQITNEIANRQLKDTEIEKSVTDLKLNVNDSLAVLNGNVGVEGSVKSVIYNSLIGKVVTSISPSEAEEQTLLRKIVVDGIPVVYASNNSEDIVHDGKKLSDVINEIEGVDVLKLKVAELETEVAILRSKLDYIESNNFIEDIKRAIITTDTFKGTEKQIGVKIDENHNVTIGFDDNAIFDAGN